MRYLPKSPSDRDQMLREIGVRSIDDLFAPIPPDSKVKGDLNIPRQMAESEIFDYFSQRSAENALGYTSFLGAGAYYHYRPVVIDSLISRGEFFTAYTPYQPEIAQGTLQAIFEFQTMICELTGMEVANASMYDGSTAATEAVLMADRITGRTGAVIARSVHPEYREVLDYLCEEPGHVAGRSRLPGERTRRSRRSRPGCHRQDLVRADPSRRISSAHSKTWPPSPTSRTRKARCWSLQSPKRFRSGLFALRSKPTLLPWKRSRSACPSDSVDPMPA